MQNLPWLIYLFFSKRKLIFTALVMAICGGLGYYASKIKLEEDISRFVPRDKNSASISSILDNLKSKDKLVIHLFSSDGEKIDRLIEKADRIYDTIQASSQKDACLDIKYKIADNTMQQVYSIFYNNIPVFLNSNDLARIERLRSPDSVRGTLKKGYETLLSPSGIVFSKYITRDPLNIVPLALKKNREHPVRREF